MAYRDLDPRIQQIATQTLTDKQLIAWTYYLAGSSWHSICLRLNIGRSTAREHVDAAHRNLRRHGVHVNRFGTYYLEETP